MMKKIPIPKVSIIVPVYNTEKHLQKCLESLINQNLKDIEIICINDCSSDESLTILKKYTTNDERIKIINFKENQGVAAARNAGIVAAIGEYIGFVDSDDFVDLDYFEKLYQHTHNNKNFVVGNIRYFYPKDNKYIESPFLEQINNNYLNFNTNFCNAIYRREFIIENNLGFTLNSNLGEDRALPIKATIINKLNGKDIVTEKSTYYTYVQNENSLYNSKLNENKIKSLIKAWSDIADFINSQETFEKEDFNYISKLLCKEYCYYFITAPKDCLNNLAKGYMLLYQRFLLKETNEEYFNKIFELTSKDNLVEAKKFIIQNRYKNITKLLKKGPINA